MAALAKVSAVREQAQLRTSSSIAPDIHRTLPQDILLSIYVGHHYALSRILRHRYALGRIPAVVTFSTSADFHTSCILHRRFTEAFHNSTPQLLSQGSQPENVWTEWVKKQKRWAGSITEAHNIHSMFTGQTKNAEHHAITAVFRIDQSAYLGCPEIFG